MEFKSNNFAHQSLALFDRCNWKYARSFVSLSQHKISSAKYATSHMVAVVHQLTSLSCGLLGRKLVKMYQIIQSMHEVARWAVTPVNRSKSFRQFITVRKPQYRSSSMNFTQFIKHTMCFNVPHQLHQHRNFNTEVKWTMYNQITANFYNHHQQ